MIRAGTQLDANRGKQVTGAGDVGDRKLKKERLRVLRIQSQRPVCGTPDLIGDGGVEAGQQTFPDTGLAGPLESVQATVSFLTGSAFGVTVVTEAEKASVKGNIDVFGKAFDQPIHLRK